MGCVACWCGRLVAAGAARDAGGVGVGSVFVWELRGGCEG